MTRKPTVNSLGNACERRVQIRNRNKDISRELLYTTKHVWKEDYQAYMSVRKKSDIWISSCIWNTWLCLHFYVTILSPDIKWKEGCENSLLACSQGRMWCFLSLFILSYIFLHLQSEFKTQQCIRNYLLQCNIIFTFNPVFFWLLKFNAIMVLNCKSYSQVMMVCNH